MSEAIRDPAIKLFGKSIPVPEHAIPAEFSHSCNQNKDGTKAEVLDEYGEAARSRPGDPEILKSFAQDASSTNNGKEVKCQDPDENGPVQENKTDEDEHAVGNGINSDQKVLKKPDKILPCPRCHSMETKFCYFNNYNVNQPRYYCRNCQRYWTAGGTMRNVPVGSGRRRNKHASSHYPQVELTPALLPMAQNEVLKAASQWHLSGGVPISSRPVEGLGDVLKFPVGTSLCQSMETVLNLKDQKGKLELSSGSMEANVDAPYLHGSSSESTVLQENLLLTKTAKHVGVTDKSYGSPPAHLLQLYPCCSWPYPWNPGWNVAEVAPEAGSSNPAYMACPPLMPSGFCSPNIRAPVVPVPNWNCIPRLPSSYCESPSSSTTSSGCSGDSTPTLGKHSRDAHFQTEENTEQSLWIPKTLRMSDPEDAAKSRIWNSLGISPKQSITTKTDILKALRLRSDSTSSTSDTDKVLQANPSAFSQSQSFQEST